VARIEARVARHPGLAVSGAGYRGSGLVDCIEGAQEAARRILDGG
jgi:protoporphyrinogen oxidase